MQKRFLCWILALLLGLIGASPAQAAGQQNATHQIDRDVIASGGGVSGSSGYVLTGTIGQPFVTGQTENSLHLNMSGFWGGGVVDYFTVTIVIEGEGYVDGPGIDCEPDCIEDYPKNANPSLTPTAAPCWQFGPWLVDGAPVSGQIVVDRDLTVTAVFEYCCPDAPAYQAPAHTAVEQALDVDLSWSMTGATSYTVSFGSSSPPPLRESGVTGTSYDPGPLERATTYYWVIEAVNACGSVSGPEWSFTTTTNQPPSITSTPPPLMNRTYRYDVEATDPDGDAIAFSLSNAPQGMTIEPLTGLIVWTAAPDQIGSFTPSVTASDTKGATSEPQEISLTVSAETFSTMTVSFLEGVNLQDGDTEQDSTVLSLGVGTDMSSVTDIVLPNVANLFSFSALASFHVELQGGAAVIVPEPGVTQIAVEDTAASGKSFEEILASNLGELTWKTAAGETVTDTTSLVFERSDGSYLKTGQFILNLTEGTLTFSYADVTP